jgi:hypothetical protein
VITPDVTTSDDVRWWIRQRVSYLGLDTWFHPSIDIRRSPEDTELLRKGNRLQEIHLEEMRVGRTGNEILASIIERGTAEALRPRIYTHPVGPYGHGSGTMIGMPEKQEFVPGFGEHPLHPNTVYAMEFSVASDTPEWGGVEVSMGLEEQAVVTEAAARFVDGYPRRLNWIR